MTRMARGAAVLFAPVALAAGVLVSGANAAPLLCGSKQCAEEITAACGGLSGADFRACKRLVLDQCKISGETFCSCTDPALPACAPTTTNTTTIPCQFIPLGGCVGSCGGSDSCVLVDTPVRTCACAAPPTCQSSAYPTCGGNCPSGSVCQGVNTACRCVPPDLPCPSGTGSACVPPSCQIDTICDGSCPPGEVCSAVGFSGSPPPPNAVCGCVPP